MSSTKTSKFVSWTLLVVAAILLFFAQSSYWVNHTVFNQASFSSITTTALLSESSRAAIATSVVDKALEDRPFVKKVAGERATSLISGLLGSDLSSQAISAVSAKTYAYVTSPNRQDIKIDLTSIKAPVAGVIALSQNNNETLTTDLNQIPDEVVLVHSDAFPDLSGMVKLMLWLGPLLWFGAIGLFALYIYLGRAVYARRVYAVGAAVIIVALFGLFTAPFVAPPIAAAVPNISLRPVAENLVTGFLAPFKVQMYYMLGITLIGLLIFSLRHKFLDLVRAVDKKLR